MVGIVGKLPLTDGVLALAPKYLLDGPALVVPPEQASLFMSIWKRSRQSVEVLRTLGVNPAVANEEDYLIFGLAVRGSAFGITDDPHAIPTADLKRMVRQCTARWHPDLRKLAEMVDESELTANPIRTSRPFPAWRASRVTLLGDAIHSMTPFQGIGANIALKDAAVLCTQLREADRGEKDLLAAVEEYEQLMRVYAFRAVGDSLRAMEFAITRKKAPGFQIAKTAMRVARRMATLKRRLIAA